MWSDCLLDLGTDFLVGNIVIAWDLQYLAVAPDFHGSYSSFWLFCEGPWFTSRQEDGCNKKAHQSYLGTERNAPVKSKLVSTLSMLLSSVLSWRVSPDTTEPSCVKPSHYVEDCNNVSLQGQTHLCRGHYVEAGNMFCYRCKHTCLHVMMLKTVNVFHFRSRHACVPVTTATWYQDPSRGLPVWPYCAEVGLTLLFQVFTCGRHQWTLST